MPQINRIRINNVKYNFGTQYYDDFVMRFNCRNTIYNADTYNYYPLLYKKIQKKLILYYYT